MAYQVRRRLHYNMFENSDYMHTFVKDFVVILSCASNPSSRKNRVKIWRDIPDYASKSKIFLILLLVVVILNIFKHKEITELSITY